MTIKYVNSDFVRNKYNLSHMEFNDLLEKGVLRGIKNGKNYLFREDSLPLNFIIKDATTTTSSSATDFR